MEWKRTNEVFIILTVVLKICDKCGKMLIIVLKMLGTSIFFFCTFDIFITKKEIKASICKAP